jgi:1-acyl-sn-glycerol-3-phosphate acyltransferase
MIIQFISKLVLKLIGWKTEGGFPDVKKYLIIIAPHTSNTDFFIGMLYGWAKGIKSKFLMKHTLFRFPVKYLLLAWGGIPVKRDKNSNLVDKLVEEYKKHESMVLTITPEGTRQQVPEWKSGFYYIAYKAEIPIVIGFIDYKRKVMGIASVFYPTGNYDLDIIKIKAFYMGVTAKYPNKYK